MLKFNKFEAILNKMGLNKVIGRPGVYENDMYRVVSKRHGYYEVYYKLFDGVVEFFGEYNRYTGHNWFKLALEMEAV